MNRKFLAISAVVCGLGGWLLLPRAAKLYVEHEYPYVKVGRVELGWPVRFLDVDVTKGSILANLREVRATPRSEDPIEVFGGEVEVRLKDPAKEKPSMPAGNRKIVAHDLIVRVFSGDNWARLDGVSVNEGYTFEVAEASYKGQRIEAMKGKISQDRKKVDVESASTMVELPFKLPRVESKGRLSMTGVHVDAASMMVNIDTLSFGEVKATKAQLSKSGKTVTGKLDSVTVDHPWIAVGPATLSKVEISTTWPIGEVKVALGSATFTADPQTKSIRGSNSCQDWVTALPRPLPDALRVPPENFSGNLSFDVQTQPKPKFVLKFDCKYKCSEEPIKSLRSGKFTYQAYNSKGDLFSRTVGRNVAGWVSLTDLPPYGPKAFITLEDPGFNHHRGIIAQALHNSLVDNLKLGQFFRGGSTITMQLAKNLFLLRHKTLSRKVYEALLAIAIESCLTKEEILELYVNVVEYGPDLYGIGPATSHYFHKGVADLNPEEAFYLAMLLPNPKRAVPPEQGGLDRARGLMKKLVNSGFLADYLMPVEAPLVDWEVSD